MISKGLCRAVLIQSGFWKKSETNELYKIASKIPNIPVLGVDKLNIITNMTVIVPKILSFLKEDGNILLYSDNRTRIMKRTI